MRDLAAAVVVFVVMGCAAATDGNAGRVAGRRPSPGAAQPAAIAGAPSLAPGTTAASADAQATSPATPSGGEVYRRARGVGGRQFVDHPVEGYPAQ